MAMNRLLVVFLFLLPSISFPADNTVTMQLNDVRVADLARIVYGDVLHINFVLDKEVIFSDESVSISWLDFNRPKIFEFTKKILGMRGFEVDIKANVLTIRKRSDEDNDLLVYLPRFRSAKYLSDIVTKVADASPLGTRSMQGSGDMQAAIQKNTEVPGAASAQFNRSASDQIAYSCLKTDCQRLRKLLADLDTPEPQIVLRAALYEVGTTKGEGSALQIASKLFAGRFVASIGSVITAGDQVKLVTGGLDTVFSVLDQDSRFKSISRPMLRVKTGAQAKFSVGQSVPILGATSYDRNGTPVQSIDYKQSGTIFTVQPDIHLDVVDLNITQELSSFVPTTTGVNNSPTMLQRTATSQLSIKPGEVVVFAGLEESKDSATDSSFFGFHMNSQKNKNTTEVLLFIEAVRI